MSLIPAKCTNCGKVIQLDRSMESGFCLYCGTKVLVKAAEAFYRAEGGRAIEVDVKKPTAFDNQVIIMRQLIEEHGDNYAKIPIKEVQNYLEQMRNLDPTNVELLLYDCLFSFYISIYDYHSYAETLCGFETLKWHAERKKKGWFSYAFEDPYGEKTYTPQRYDAWKNVHVDRDGNWRIESDSYMKKALFKTSRLLNSEDHNSIVRFVELFMLMISNQSFYTDWYKISVKNGIICASEDRSGNNNHSEIKYNRSHRSQEKLCVADNVIEFFIPFLREMLPSPNKELLIDALYNECEKYPHSNYVRS